MKRKIFAYHASSIVIGIIAIVAFVTIQNLNNSYKWVQHTYDVIVQLEHIKDDLNDCQTSVRETVFGDDDHLDLYDRKHPGIEGQIDHLQWLTRDNEKQQKKVYELRLNIN